MPSSILMDAQSTNWKLIVASHENMTVHFGCCRVPLTRCCLWAQHHPARAVSAWDSPRIPADLVRFNLSVTHHQGSCIHWKLVASWLWWLCFIPWKPVVLLLCHINLPVHHLPCRSQRTLGNWSQLSCDMYSSLAVFPARWSRMSLLSPSLTKKLFF